MTTGIVRLTTVVLLPENASVVNEVTVEDWTRNPSDQSGHNCLNSNSHRLLFHFDAL